MADDLLSRITESVVQGEEGNAVELARRALEAGFEPMAIVENGLTPGMNIIGAQFSSGECFIPHLVMAAKAMKSAMRLLEPELKGRNQSVERAGTAVIGTVRGDIHEIGKSLVGIMLTANGFEVHDLGVDVAPEAFVSKVQETGAGIVGLSALLTTTMIMQRRIIEALGREGFGDRVKVMVGGAPVSQGWADEIGADGYAEDATGAVTLAKALVAGRH
jgi:corrinoid protein of di/trimethylamine methyltransferase